LFYIDNKEMPCSKYRLKSIHITSNLRTGPKYDKKGYSKNDIIKPSRELLCLSEAFLFIPNQKSTVLKLLINMKLKNAKFNSQKQLSCHNKKNLRTEQFGTVERVMLYFLVTVGRFKYQSL